MADSRWVVIGPDACVLRRRLGPTAWVVLEAMLTRSSGNADGCEANASVRSLAIEVGLSKDTVARALARLRRAGIAAVSQDRATPGTFASSRYRIVVPDGIEFIDAIASPPAPTRAKPSRPISGEGTQLTLSLDG